MKKDELPVFEVISITEEPETGMALIDFEVNEAFKDLVRKEKGYKRVTRKRLSDFMLEILHKAFDKIDEYDIVTEKENGENL